MSIPDGESDSIPIFWSIVDSPDLRRIRSGAMPMLKSFAEYVVFSLIGLARGSRLGEALNFFCYDTIKIFLLLTTIIFCVALVRSYFSS